MGKARIKNSRDVYGVVAITLHWLVFILIVGLLGSGKYSASLALSEKSKDIIDIHMQVGLVVFLLMALRFLWRMMNKTPTPLSENALVRGLATLVHYLFYVLVLLQAYTGVVYLQVLTNKVALLGLEVPSLASGGEGLASFFSFILLDTSAVLSAQLRELHGWFADGLIALIVIHVIGALIHHIYHGDYTLRRMFFGFVPDYAKKSHYQ